MILGLLITRRGAVEKRDCVFGERDVASRRRNPRDARVLASAGKISTNEEHSLTFPNETSRVLPLFLWYSEKNAESFLWEFE